MAVLPCPTPAPQPVYGIVTFEVNVFKTQFPAFATVADAALTFNFTLATLILNNSCCSVVKDANVRQVLLYTLVAHLTALAQGASGNPPSGIVGRIDKAAEGSVSVSAAYAAEMSVSEAYFAQTQYGALFWQMTAPFRTMHYVAPPVNACVGGFPGYFGPVGRPGGGCC